MKYLRSNGNQNRLYTMLKECFLYFINTGISRYLGVQFYVEEPVSDL